MPEARQSRFLGISHAGQDTNGDNMTAAKYRPLTFGVTRATLRDGVTGVHYLRADQDLAPFPAR
jgi:hypothetical protein